MHLLELKADRVSLEFETVEFDDILARLKQSSRLAGHSGEVVRRQATTHDMLSIDGIEFILMGDFEEPCLIARTEAGNRLLRSVHDAAVRDGDKAA